MPTKTVLITGVNGFIGSHVARRLTKDYQIVGLGTSSVDRFGLCHRYIQMMLPHADFTQVIAQYQPDFCLHFAGSAAAGRLFDRFQLQRYAAGLYFAGGGMGRTPARGDQGA